MQNDRFHPDLRYEITRVPNENLIEILRNQLKSNSYKVQNRVRSSIHERSKGIDKFILDTSNL
jgi:hypothetical protein